ncbi:MAG: NAD(P)H-binding protein, partial [Acetobacteraceae bacterium]|nr:NAD(P)H-binding protein [Acetobacteraceae bacterium]
MTRRVATVFGGSGFIGRYVVQRLAARGYTIRVVARHTERVKTLFTQGAVGQVVGLYGSFSNPSTILRATEGAELIVNLVGILAEQKAGDFQRIQAEGPGLIARGAAEAGASRLVQISAIGADSSSPSQYGRTKAAGEAAARAAFPGTVVMRPSLVFGEED